MCSNYEAVDDLSVDCIKCRKRTHMCWAEEPVVKFIISGFPNHSWTIPLSYHITFGYDTQFQLKNFLEMRWTHKLIMDGTKILSMFAENLLF